MRILGINAIFHDPAAALVIDGQVVAAAEEERFNRRERGKRPVPFSAWEQPVLAAGWCLDRAGLSPGEIDLVGFSYDPSMVLPPEESGLDDPWDPLRTEFAFHAPGFLADALPGLDPDRVRFVPHHVAHAASAALAVRDRACSVLVCDGRGERHSHLSGRFQDGALTVLSSQPLPHSLGLMYEGLTEHLGFLRARDEHEVIALGAYGKPRHLDRLRAAVRVHDDGGFTTDPIPWSELAPPLRRDAGDGHATVGATVPAAGGPAGRDPRRGVRAAGDQAAYGRALGQAHADLAASVQRRLEEVLLDLAWWLHERTGDRLLTMAGSTALNCVANTFLARYGPFEDVWVPPGAGDAGTALGAALYLAAEAGDPAWAMDGADLGREFDDTAIESALRRARVPFERPDDVAEQAAEVLAEHGIVAWFQGRGEFGPRALGHRSLLAHPGRRANVDRLNDVKGYERFQPLAPMVRLDRAAEIFERGPIPSPYMLFVHDVAAQWQDRIPAVVHVDGTARVQTVNPVEEPLLTRLLDAFERRTGLPLLVNSSLSTAGRPMIDDVRDALELFGAAPVDLLAIGPFTVRR
ncbi:carbamoyltransferase family protein [Actinomadura alba]|uniref:carbamoyltransferase family protein n=1 Tax=Actinomadura alba TaxID=406431 RepID=UPI0028A6639D|nr:carbamoyltransferase C-terminal domain-containing protein [Actinomadura alba]